MRPVPYPKKIEIKEKLFYQFKVDASNYALFDSTMTTPVVFGSFNLVGATIKNLDKDVTIFYFEVDEQNGWKMKRRFSPDKKTISSSDAKKTVVNTEMKKKSLT